MRTALLLALASCVLIGCNNASDNKTPDGKITVKATIKGDLPEYVMVYSDAITDVKGIDTIYLKGQNTIEKTYTLGNDSPGYLIIPDAGSVTLFFEKGTTTGANVEISTDDEGAPATNVIDYIGDNGDAARFIDDMQQWQYSDTWSFERLDTTRFSDYRRLFLAEVDSVYASLNKVQRLVPRRQLRQYIDQSTFGSLFRYAWSDADITDPEFVAFAQSIDLNDPENLDNISRYMRWYGRLHPQTKGIEGYIARLREIISNEDIVNVYAREYMQSIIQDGDPGMAEAFDYYKQNINDAEAQAELQEMYDHYIKLTPGAEAASFTMTDRDGNEVSIEDLRGKALYIDVWATWCGPCCAEIPYVEQLVDHYKDDERIQFVSISLDEDRESWLKKLDKDKPTWPQYICPDNFQSGLAKNYDIDAIPRFLFFDKDGNVISLTAPRPSSEGIIEYIDSHIN